MLFPSAKLIGRGGGLDPATRAYINRMTVKPTSQRAKIIDELVKGLKSAGVWTALDALWLFATHDAQAARLNVVSPSYEVLSSTNFIVDRGSRPGDIQNYSFGAAGNKFQSNNGHLSAHGFINGGNRAVVGRLRNYISFQSDNRRVVGGIQTYDSLIIQAAQDVSFIVSRTSSGFFRGKYADNAVVQQNAASEPIDADNSTPFFSFQISDAASVYLRSASVGSGLTDAQMNSLRALLKNYYQGIGQP